ncbi:MAG: hypothetical protein M3Y34_03015 [Actinomycetota bacterium]|nr:hypothetical protein [Actinomycetota bacterium]
MVLGSIGFPASAVGAPGDLDETFGDGGTVTTEVPYELPRSDRLSEAALQVDGKLVAAGASDGDFAVARYLPNGELDPAFGEGGKVIADLGNPLRNWVGDMLVLDDGKIVVAGGLGSDDKARFAIARFNPDGSLDSSFSRDGMRFVGFPETAWVNEIVALDSGRVLAIGTASDYDEQLAMARLESDGSLDSSFGDGGKRFDDGIFTPKDAAVQEDGKIILTGCAGCGTPATHTEFGLARLEANGSLDSEFGGDGVIYRDFGPAHSFVSGESVAIQEDGRILAAVGGGDVSLTRWETDGTLDSTFTDGVEQELVPLGIHELAIDGEGRIVAAGARDGDFAVARFDAEGELDQEFSDDGWRKADFGANDFATAIALTSDGTVLAAGSKASVYGKEVDGDFAFARYGADGSPDDSFSGDGLLTTGFGNVNVPSDARTVGGAIAPDGKILALADTDPRRGPPGFAVLRYHRSGTLDAGFAGDGIMIETAGFGVEASALAVQPDGKVLVGGTNNQDPSHGEAWVLWRYNPDGSPDVSFGESGKVVYDLGPPPYSHLEDLAVAEDGTIVGAGHTFSGDRDYALARFLSDGAPDPAFGNGGSVILDSGGPEWSWAEAVATADDQRIVAAGQTEDYANRGPSDFSLVGLTADGALDGEFGDAGLVQTDFLREDRALDLAIGPEGDIVVAGSTFDQGDGFRFALARYSPLGFLDPTFSSDGLAQRRFKRSAGAEAVAIQEDERIVAAGWAGDFMYGSFAFARFEPGGALDQTFSGDGRVTIDLGGDDSVVALGLQPRRIIGIGQTGDGEFHSVGLAAVKRGR